LAQRFQRDDFFAHKRPESRHYLAIRQKIVAVGGGRNDFSALRATISACARVVPSPADLLALAP
jgi:hypothetical protein